MGRSKRTRNSSGNEARIVFKPGYAEVDMSNVTELINAAAAGNRQAAAELLPLVYDELRKLAAARLSAEATGQTLQPTDLVHEAYLRLVGPADMTRWANCGHFFAAAAEAMRRILVEAARRKRALKRGGNPARIQIELDELSIGETDLDRWLDLDSVLTSFETVDPAAAELAKLRLFGGLSVEQASEALGLSRAGAFRIWTYCQAWLTAALTDRPEKPGGDK
jgi:RNA polymerase sigma factor (TIGR02999 family)